MSAVRCVGVLMAGGASLRFHGLPKGLALVNEKRIADRALDALRAATDAQVVVANDPRAARWFPDVPIVADAEIGLGPLAGLYTALHAAEGAAILVVAWDMPFVSSDLLLALRTRGESGASAVVPSARGDGPPSPLCAYYAAGALAACEALLAQGERRALALFHALPGAVRFDGATLAAYGDPARLLLSVDSADDLATLGGVLPEDEEMGRR